MNIPAKSAKKSSGEECSWLRKAGAVCVLLTGLASSWAATAAGREKFPGFVVHPHEGDGPEFEFSSAYATSASPVVIKVVGRKTKESDAEFRTSLQKHWLAENVPHTAELRMREQVLCDFGSGRGRCDRYEFEPGGDEHSYYFYLNNWK